MTEPRVPNTLPSPVDREEFRFLAAGAAGTIWERTDDELVWVRVGQEEGLKWRSERRMRYGALTRATLTAALTLTSAGTRLGVTAVVVRRRQMGLWQRWPHTLGVAAAVSPANRYPGDSAAPPAVHRRRSHPAE